MKYKTCVSIAEKTPKRLEQTLIKALKKSEYAELRLDFLRPVDVPDALELVKRHLDRCVCTLRPKNEGGVFTGTPKERISILKLIAEYKPYLIDIEFSTMLKNKDLVKYVKKTTVSVLVSWHDFKKTPSTAQLGKKFLQMKKFSRYIKIVTSAKNVNDASNVLSLYSKVSSSPTKPSLIAFAMGDEGRISRILCLYLGSPYTYVSLGKPIAAGQFSVDQIKKITSLDTTTR